MSSGSLSEFGSFRIPTSATIPEAAMGDNAQFPDYDTAYVDSPNIPQTNQYQSLAERTASLRSQNGDTEFPWGSEMQNAGTGGDVEDYPSFPANADLTAEPQENAIDQALSSKGYKLLDRIAIKDGVKQDVKFLKASNEKGQKVFIITGNEKINPANDDVLLERVQSTENIPHSSKTGAFDCAGTNTCGVALECGNSLCVIVRKPGDVDPQEHNFKFYQKEKIEVKYSKTTVVVSYPIVHISEIMQDHRASLHNCDAVLRRLRNNAYMQAVEELSEMKECITKLNRAFIHFNGLRENYACKIAKTLRQLEEWNEKYAACEHLTEEAKYKHALIKNNLIKRNEDVVSLICMINAVSEKKHVIDSIAVEIQECSALADSEFCNVEMALHA